jgi:hypothetical protein
MQRSQAVLLFVRMKDFYAIHSPALSTVRILCLAFATSGEQLQISFTDLIIYLHSLSVANRRAQEVEMWERRKAQLEREGISTDRAFPSPATAFVDGKKRKRNEDEQGCDTDNKEEEEEEEGEGRERGKDQRFIRTSVHNRLGKLKFSGEDEELLYIGGGDGGGGGGVQRKVRGRGSTGPRIGLHGECVPDPQIGLDIPLVGKKEVKRKTSPSEPEERKKDMRSTSGSSRSVSSTASSSSDSDSEEEERRRRRKRKRRRKEKEHRKVDKKRRKETRRKKEKIEGKKKRSERAEKNKAP